MQFSVKLRVTQNVVSQLLKQIDSPGKKQLYKGNCSFVVYYILVTASWMTPPTPSSSAMR